MQVTYFDNNGMPQEKKFSPFTHNGENVTTLPNQDVVPSPGQSQFVTHKDYDETLKSYQKLDGGTKDLYRRVLAHNSDPKKNPSPLDDKNQAGFQKALKDAGLSTSTHDQAIVKDHIGGGNHRRGTVYSVGGNPVLDTNMNTRVVSHYMGGGMQQTDQHISALKDKPEVFAQRMIDKGLVPNPEKAAAVVNSEAVMRIRGPAAKPISATSLKGKGGLLGAVATAGIAAAMTSQNASAAEMATAAGSALANSALPGVTDGFKDIRSSHVGTLDKAFNVADTLSAGLATAATIAAPFTAGATLPVAGIASATNLGLSALHDGAKALGVTQQGGIITSAVNTVQGLVDTTKSKDQIVTGFPTSGTKGRGPGHYDVLHQSAQSSSSHSPAGSVSIAKTVDEKPVRSTRQTARPAAAAALTT